MFATVQRAFAVNLLIVLSGDIAFSLVPWAEKIAQVKSVTDGRVACDLDRPPHPPEPNVVQQWVLELWQIAAKVPPQGSGKNSASDASWRINGQHALSTLSLGGAREGDLADKTSKRVLHFHLRHFVPSTVLVGSCAATSSILR